MAFFDRPAAQRRQECAEVYEKLKEHLRKPDKDNKLSEFALALEHMESLEQSLENAQKRVKEFEELSANFRRIFLKDLAFL